VSWRPECAPRRLRRICFRVRAAAAGAYGVRGPRLREALRRQLYHREQYQKALDANRQVVLVCERSLEKSEARPLRRRPNPSWRSLLQTQS